MPNLNQSPTRRTAESQLDAWNDQFRQSAVYQDFMRRNGLPTNGRVKLSRSQQSALESEMRRAGIQVPSGMHIDQGGSLNQKNRLARNIGIGAAATGAALTGFGLAGMGPLSGLGSAGAASGAGAAAGGVLPSSSLPVASLMGGPAAIASQGVSAGIPLGGLLPNMGGRLIPGLTRAVAPSITSQGASNAAGGFGAALKNIAGKTLKGAGKRALDHLTSPQGSDLLGDVISALAGRGGIPGGMANGGSGSALPLSQELMNAARMTEARVRRTDPLHQAVTQLAFNRLPVSAREGIDRPNVPLPGVF
jgi:hypothetical protein